MTALPVKVGLSGEEGYPHAGKVDFLDNQVARSTGTIRVRALLDNADRQFTPGLFARVQLLAAPVRAMLIDDKAVLTDQDRKYVYVVTRMARPSAATSSSATPPTACALSSTARRRQGDHRRRAEGLHAGHAGAGQGRGDAAAGCAAFRAAMPPPP